MNGDSLVHNIRLLSGRYIWHVIFVTFRIGRHSKSLDTASKVCGYCMSPFELICNSGNRQQTPNRFAQFVKSSYGSLKKQGQLSHQETMRKLAADFASKNKVDKWCEKVLLYLLMCFMGYEKIAFVLSNVCLSLLYISVVHFYFDY